MPKRNRLSRAVGAINLLPRRLRSRSLTLLLGSQVRFAGTARVRIHELGQERAILSLKNRRPVQNHIKGIHAAAMALLAESASGFLVGMNVPDDKLPLIKTMKIDYLKRAQGDLTAIATLEAGRADPATGQGRGPRGGAGQRRERQPADRLRDGLGLGRQETPGRYRSP